MAHHRDLEQNYINWNCGVTLHIFALKDISDFYWTITCFLLITTILDQEHFKKYFIGVGVGRRGELLKPWFLDIRLISKKGLSYRKSCWSSKRPKSLQIKGLLRVLPFEGILFLHQSQIKILLGRQFPPLVTMLKKGLTSRVKSFKMRCSISTV